jgi:hypothetical protein
MNIHLMMMAVLDDESNTDPQQGLFNVWDYLEEEGFPTHHVAEYIENSGELLTNKALLAKMVDL